MKAALAVTLEYQPEWSSELGISPSAHPASSHIWGIGPRCTQSTCSTETWVMRLSKSQLVLTTQQELQRPLLLCPFKVISLWCQGRCLNQHWTYWINSKPQLAVGASITQCCCWCLPNYHHLSSFAPSHPKWPPCHFMSQSLLLLVTHTGLLLHFYSLLIRSPLQSCQHQSDHSITQFRTETEPASCGYCLFKQQMIYSSQLYY